MNSQEIDRILSQDPYISRYYAGVYPCDQIPILKQESAIVINTDPHDEAGSHWVAAFIEYEKMEFFDSYGLSPANYGKDIELFAQRYRNLEWNRTPLQSITSNVCGPYCIYYLYKKSRGMSLSCIVNRLPLRGKSDPMIYLFVKKKYGVTFSFKK